MQKQNNNFKKKKSLIIQICNSFIKIISNFIFPNKSTKRNIVIMSSPQQLCSLWLYSCNNFALFNNSTHNWNKQHLSLSLSHFSLLYYHFNSFTLLLSSQHFQFTLYLLSVHFFPIFSLCQQKKYVYIYIYFMYLRVFFFCDIDIFILFLY